MAAVTSCEKTLYQFDAKLKELVNLCSLFRFQLFTISNKDNSSNQKLQNYWVAKR